MFIEVTACAGIYCNWHVSADNVILPIAVKSFIFSSIRSTEEETKIKTGQVHMRGFIWMIIYTVIGKLICAKMGLSAVTLIRECM